MSERMMRFMVDGVCGVRRAERAAGPIAAGADDSSFCACPGCRVTSVARYSHVRGTIVSRL